MGAVADWLLIGLVLILIFGLVRNTFKWGMDDTDRDAWHRSGLRVYTDHKTGVEYVGTSNGGLTPRVLPAIVSIKSMAEKP